MSVISVALKQAINHPGWTRGAAALGAGGAASTVAVAADAVMRSQHTHADGRWSAPRHHNTIETFNQHNSETSGVSAKRGRLLPAHVVDGIRSGVAQAFGGQSRIDLSNQSLAYQYRANEWQDLSRSVTQLAQGVALAVTPAALGSAVARAGQWLQSTQWQGLAGNRLGRHVAEVGVAALVAHADPAAIAITNRSARSRGAHSDRAVATQPHQQQAQEPFAYLSGPKESWRLFDAYQLNARNGAVSGDLFTSFHASDALSLMKQATSPKNIAAYIAQHYQPGEPLVLNSASKSTKQLLKKLAKE